MGSGFISFQCLEKEERGGSDLLLAAFDLLLIGLALIINFVGLSRRWSAWRRGLKEERSGDWTGLLGYLLGHGKILKNRRPGRAHLIVFWGFLIPLFIIILAHFGFTIPLIPALFLSLLTDLLGAAFLGGTLFFLVKRIRSMDSRGPERVLFPMFVLVVILITGFLAEGVRLSIVHPQFTWASPLGWLLSAGLPASPIFMHWMIRVHFFAVLFFIALLPFTFIRHLAAAPLNVFYRKKEARGALKGISLDEGPIGAGTVRDFTWKQLLDAEACVSCGRCEENCPASISGKPLSPRKVIQDILEQMAPLIRNSLNTDHESLPLLETRITRDEIWSCTTCMACVEHCPVFIEPMDKIIDMRRYQVLGKGRLPAGARSLIRNLEIYGDVQGRGIACRRDWALNRDVPLYHAEGLNPEILLWVGCSGAFHPRSQEITRAMVKILKASGVSFGILGKDELCCGDPARRMGEERLFLDLARKNIRQIKKHHVKKIVTLCPHCFNTLKNEYPPLEADGRSGEKWGIEVVHAAEYVMGLIRGGRVSPKYPINKIAALHDPCYLGRVNRVYDPPREMIRSLPEIRVRELKRHHEKGFCCGGGGGRNVAP